MKVHRYYLINRPGVFPDYPFNHQETWIPARKIPGTERYAWGFVDFDKKLEFATVHKWDLFPANESELEAYWNWRDENEI